MTSLGARVTVGMISMNEEKAVAEVIKAIRDALPDAEILIVDSSEDNTPAIAEALGARVIRQYPPRGYGAAMMALLRESRREVVVTLDCDNTYPAYEIPELARLILEEGYDLVDASRLEQKPVAMPWLNYLANRFFAGMASLLFCRTFRDLHSGMRAYRKTMLDALHFTARGSALPVELLLKPLRHGYRLRVVYIDYHERIGQSKMRPFHSAWWTLKRIVRVRLGLIH